MFSCSSAWSGITLLLLPAWMLPTVNTADSPGATSRATMVCSRMTIIAARTVGTITAVGGGTIRDVMIRRIPTVLSSELYAIPALIGAGCAATAHGFGYGGTLPALGAAAV